ncbi:MAG: YggT family protein [Deltaproteobacteria bacterium]|nr:YggT family protein [Deltaproteobacteria bacterium]
MFVIVNLLTAIAYILRIVLYVFTILLIIRTVLSWLPSQQLYRYAHFIQLVVKSTEWLLGPLRRRLSLVQGGFDLSPLVALLILYFLDLFLVKSLFMLASKLAGV